MSARAVNVDYPFPVACLTLQKKKGRGALNLLGGVIELFGGSWRRAQAAFIA